MTVGKKDIDGWIAPRRVKGNNILMYDITNGLRHQILTQNLKVFNIWSLLLCIINLIHKIFGARLVTHTKTNNNR